MKTSQPTNSNPLNNNVNNTPKLKNKLASGRISTPRGGQGTPRTPRNFKKNSMKPQQEKTDKKDKHDGCIEMFHTVGMVGRKFHIDEMDKMKYQPWDCVSVTEDSFAKFCRSIEKRKQVISYCRGSFMKIYPRGTRFDSSNCDPVKSWICGAQISALNLQSTEDDFVLLNKVFFKMSKGYGFLLKPDFLRNEKAQVRTYKNPTMNLLLKLISGIMLQNILKIDGVMEKFQEIAVTLRILGSFEDDCYNKEYCTDYINQNFINPIFTNAIINFKVYEPDLSFLIIKIISGKTILARAIIPIMAIEEGIKVVTLYDNKCKEIENSLLVLKVTKTILSTKLD